MSAPNSHAAVLALDLQRDFLEDGGRMPIARAQVEPLIAAANAIAAAATARARPVVLVGNEFPASQWILNVLRRHAAEAGSPGAATDPRVHLGESAYFPKTEGSAFTNPALEAYLRDAGIDELVVLGVFAGACVRATCLGAMERGFAVTLVREGVGAGSDGGRTRALASLGRAGARIASTDEAIARLG
jgi:nicotinamidase-related amidase